MAPSPCLLHRRRDHASHQRTRARPGIHRSTTRRAMRMATTPVPLSTTSLSVLPALSPRSVATATATATAATAAATAATATTATTAATDVDPAPQPANARQPPGMVARGDAFPQRRPQEGARPPRRDGVRQDRRRSGPRQVVGAPAAGTRRVGSGDAPRARQVGRRHPARGVLRGPTMVLLDDPESPTAPARREVAQLLRKQDAGTDVCSRGATLCPIVVTCTQVRHPDMRDLAVPRASVRRTPTAQQIQQWFQHAAVPVQRPDGGRARGRLRRLAPPAERPLRPRRRAACGQRDPMGARRPARTGLSDAAEARRAAARSVNILRRPAGCCCAALAPWRWDRARGGARHRSPARAPTRARARPGAARPRPRRAGRGAGPRTRPLRAARQRRAAPPARRRTDRADHQPDSRCRSTRSAASCSERLGSPFRNHSRDETHDCQ